MKLSRHNGRANKNGAYKVSHNDRKFDVDIADHIDKEKYKANIYWDCYQGYYSEELLPRKDGEVPAPFLDVEKLYYREHYSDFCERQNERNHAARHFNRDRTPEDLRQDKRTCPEESILQIGNIDESVSPDVLAEIATEYFEEFNRRFGNHVHILNRAPHLDEATPHIHERHVFDCENKYGEIAPQQEKALEALGIEPPEPDKKINRTNNRKITFDKICRALLLDISKKHGLSLDEKPEYGGRLLDMLMTRFQGFTERISARLNQILSKSSVKEESKELIKQSILSELKQAKVVQAEREKNRSKVIHKNKQRGSELE